MAKMICFDMDGTIADLYGVEGWLEKLNAEDASPYVYATPMWDMDKLRSVLLRLIEMGWEIRIISWLAKDSTEEYKKAVRVAKRNWLEQYNFPVNKMHFIAYGTTKANAVRKAANGEVCILIDDSDKVRQGWTLGETINPLEIDDLPEYLEKYTGKEYDTRTYAETLGIPAWM